MCICLFKKLMAYIGYLSHGGLFSYENSYKHKLKGLSDNVTVVFQS